MTDASNPRQLFFDLNNEYIMTTMPKGSVRQALYDKTNKIWEALPDNVKKAYKDRVKGRAPDNFLPPASDYPLIEEAAEEEEEDQVPTTKAPTKIKLPSGWTVLARNKDVLYCNAKSKIFFTSPPQKMDDTMLEELEKDSNKAKRPANVYAVYVKQTRPTLVAEGIKPAEVMAELGRRWRALSEEEKNKMKALLPPSEAAEKKETLPSAYTLFAKENETAVCAELVDKTERQNALKVAWEAADQHKYKMARYELAVERNKVLAAQGKEPIKVKMPAADKPNKKKRKADAVEASGSDNSAPPAPAPAHKFVLSQFD